MKAAPQNYVIVALGSNLGDSKAILDEVVARMSHFSDAPLLCSSFWETDPVDCPPGSPKFLNAVVAFLPRVPETPESLFAQLQRLEKQFGRQPKAMVNEARPLDLDLVAFQTELHRGPKLIVPHPKAHERAFVLAPLAEILPTLVLPGQVQQVSELLKNLTMDKTGGVRRV